ncbi:MAG: TolB protein [Zetaproteobacteria bacterium CG_4_9_14_3_um_filter_54_145]|nr:MAG: TolB protein [Zetaproteobacteria bacterium CG_4_10_14_3_um_filter_54_28]PJA29052.1 MAG: TolB protein [Zetaproteobacteria bacterium CG_4_9_14_3_um_filter_54_145]
MKRIIGLILGLTAASPLASANTILDWMDEHRPAAIQGQSHQETPADDARLLTLEPGETEMYARPSPDGRFLMNLSSKGKLSWIARRYSENGDPANRITDDDRALDSIGWRDDGHVYYLSERAGGLGLWEKISDGEGMQRRIQSLHGMITQPILLPDQSIIAVRLKQAGRGSKQHKQHRTVDNFNNWDFPDFLTEIVHFNADGSERVLSAGVNPALSPDGKWIAFAMPTGRSMHLFRMHTDGSELIQITDSRSEDVQPAWSRDGRWLLFTSNRANPDLRHSEKSEWDIWRIGTNGRNLTQLTRDPARDGGAAMGTDGKVYFHSDRKISSEQRAEHQIKSHSVSGFHIWSIDLPKQADPVAN